MVYDLYMCVCAQYATSLPTGIVTEVGDGPHIVAIAGDAVVVATAPSYLSNVGASDADGHGGLPRPDPRCRTDLVATPEAARSARVQPLPLATRLAGKTAVCAHFCLLS